MLTLPSVVPVRIAELLLELVAMVPAPVLLPTEVTTQLTKDETVCVVLLDKLTTAFKAAVAVFWMLVSPLWTKEMMRFVIVGSSTFSAKVPVMAVELPAGVKLAVMVEEPLATPVASPLVLIVTLDVSADDQLTDEVRSAVVPSL